MKKLETMLIKHEITYSYEEMSEAFEYLKKRGAQISRTWPLGSGEYVVIGYEPVKGCRVKLKA